MQCLRSTESRPWREPARLLHYVTGCNGPSLPDRIGDRHLEEPSDGRKLFDGQKPGLFSHGRNVRTTPANCMTGSIFSRSCDIPPQGTKVQS